MREYLAETVVVAGGTTEYGFVGVMPPLTSEEIQTMQSAAVLDPGHLIRQMHEYPPATLIRINRDPGSLSTVQRIERAQDTAAKIAAVLKAARSTKHISPPGL